MEVLQEGPLKLVRGVFFKLAAKNTHVIAFILRLVSKYIFFGQGIQIDRFQDLINKIVLLAMAIGGIVLSVRSKIEIGAANFADHLSL